MTGARSRLAALIALGAAALATGAAGAAGGGGAQQWVVRYDSGGPDYDVASMVAAAPDGARVFVAGQANGAFLTVAYDAATGGELWLRARRPGVDGGAAALATSPDGARVFATGGESGAVTTVSYDAATGAPAWSSHWRAGADGPDAGAAIAVAPDGARVFVTGSRSFGDVGWTHVTIAYDAATGAKLWVRRYGKQYLGGSTGGEQAIAVSRDGRSVFVTGTLADAEGNLGYATVAYDAQTGAPLWARRYHGGGFAVASGLAVAPDGTSVVVTGATGNVSGVPAHFATLAYDASTGETLWARGGDRSDGLYGARAVAFSPDGTRVVVTGDVATVAYAAATGKPLWLDRVAGTALAFDRDGTRVYVTGSVRSSGSPSVYEYATGAYDVADGTALWTADYDSGTGDSKAASLALGPDGGTVYVTGDTTHEAAPPYDLDLATVAYQAR